MNNVALSGAVCGNNAGKVNATIDDECRVTSDDVIGHKKLRYEDWHMSIFRESGEDTSECALIQHYQK